MRIKSFAKILWALPLLLTACASATYELRKPAAAMPTKVQFFTKSTEAGLVPISGATFADPIIVKITALPRTKCSVRVSQPLGDRSYRSQALFAADAEGVISTDTSAPLSAPGNYAKADFYGLFWTMQPAPLDPSLQPNAYTFQVACEGSAEVKTVLPQIYAKPGVRIVPLTGTGLVGLLYLPPTDLGPRPAVIAFSGSEGKALTGEEKAIYLANHGYVGLGLAYFGETGVPKELVNIPLEYFQKAIQYLRSRPEVQPDKIAVLGVSRGGELALLLGATFPQITAVIGQVPGPIAFGGNSETATGFVPAWTYQGKPIPAAQDTPYFSPITLSDGTVAQCNRPYFENVLKKPEEVKAAFIPIEKTNGPILLLGGEDDQVWPSCTLSQMAMAHLKKRGHKFPDQAICYPRAGHGVGGVPGFSTMVNHLYDEPLHAVLYFGGTPDGDAFGIQDSWERIIAFLRKNFGD